MTRSLVTTALRAAAALLLVAMTSRTAPAVTMQLTSAQVANAGEAARLCVILGSGGQQVAGTENQFTWDGNCASLPDEGSCAVAGAHGKQLSATTKCGDFCFKAIILSLGDVDPIPDGPLYCCNFQSEAEPGQCCTINMVNALASDPGGNALQVSGRGGQICTAGSSGQPGRGFDRMGTNQPGFASNAPAGGDVGAAAPPPAPPGARPGVPSAQVLQGGGVRAGNTPEAALALPTQPALDLPTAAAAPARTAAAPAVATQPVVAVTPRASAPPVAPPTSAATEAVTAPAVDTATPKATAAATRAATKATAPPKAAAAPPPAQAEGGGGWFGCQIGAGASVAPVMGLALLALIGRVARRRSRSQTQQSRGGYGDDE
jgi:hypothetical protein